ncbi:MAG: hypothetical protein ACLP6G_16570 [Terriglobales bacterium]
MRAIGRSTRLCLWVPAAILGPLGVYVVVAGTDLGGMDWRKADDWLALLVPSVAMLLPPVLYLLTLPRYLGSDVLRSEVQASDSPGPASTNPGPFPLVLSVALYLPLMILMAVDVPPRAGPLFKAIPLFLTLWISCASANQWLRGESPVLPAENRRWSRLLDRCLETTSRFAPPPVLLLLGAILLAYTPWSDPDAIRFLKGQEMWITAEYGLGHDISAAKVILEYFGRFVYGGSLVLAACAVVLLLVSRFSVARLRNSRAAKILGLATVFLAICSISDFYFSWMTFLTSDRLPALRWIFFVLFFLHWLVPVFLGISVWSGAGQRENQARLRLRTAVVFYAPLLLFDLAMTPFFLGDALFPCVFVGLQLLAWGYLQLATLPQPLNLATGRTSTL